MTWHYKGCRTTVTRSSAALDQISARQGLPPGRRDSFSLGGAFGLATPGGYVDVRRRLRDLRTMWGDKQGFYGYLREHRLTAFGQALTSVAQECEGALAFLREEPLLFAQIQFDMAQLALAARYAWSPHDTLYQAQIKPWLDNALPSPQSLKPTNSSELFTAQSLDIRVASYVNTKALSPLTPLRHGAMTSHGSVRCCVPRPQRPSAVCSSEGHTARMPSSWIISIPSR